MRISHLRIQAVGYSCGKTLIYTSKRRKRAWNQYETHSWSPKQVFIGQFTESAVVTIPKKSDQRVQRNKTLTKR